MAGPKVSSRVIVADTNVLSEPMRASPDPAVLRWLARHKNELALTTITIGELRYGARRLAVGRRRTELMAAIDGLVSEAGERILAFDLDAAEHYAVIRSDREAGGLSVGVEDTMIAAICRTVGASVATRNVADFAGAGIDVINPWTDE